MIESSAKVVALASTDKFAAASPFSVCSLAAIGTIIPTRKHRSLCLRIQNGWCELSLPPLRFRPLHGIRSEAKKSVLFETAHSRRSHPKMDRGAKGLFRCHGAAQSSRSYQLLTKHNSFSIDGLPGVTTNKLAGPAPRVNPKSAPSF